MGAWRSWAIRRCAGGGRHGRRSWPYRSWRSEVLATRACRVSMDVTVCMPRTIRLRKVYAVGSMLLTTMRQGGRPTVHLSVLVAARHCLINLHTLTQMENEKFSIHKLIFTIELCAWSHRIQVIIATWNAIQHVLHIGLPSFELLNASEVCENQIPINWPASLRRADERRTEVDRPLMTPRKPESPSLTGTDGPIARDCCQWRHTIVSSTCRL